MYKVILFVLLISSIDIHSQEYKKYMDEFESCFNKKEYSCAEQNLSKAIPLAQANNDDKFLIICYSNLGTTLRRQDKNQEALSAYNKALEIDSNHVKV